MQQQLPGKVRVSLAMALFLTIALILLFLAGHEVSAVVTRI
jgi:hypothetical protein